MTHSRSWRLAPAAGACCAALVAVLGAPWPFPRVVLAGDPTSWCRLPFLCDLAVVLAAGLYGAIGLVLLAVTLNASLVLLRSLHWLGREILVSWGWRR